MKDIDLLKSIIPPIHRAGYPFIILFIICTIIFSTLSNFLGWIGIILTIWCVFFFRDPERVIPKKDNILVAPADGRILSISTELAPENLTEDKQKKMNKISIFMNVFNVHVNRSPMSGTISKKNYIPGLFFNASLDKASKENERLSLVMNVNNKIKIAFVQIAGLLARRIVNEAQEGNKLVTGEIFGIIRFGSKVDVYIPLGSKINVLKGQTSIAGETILAEINSKKK